MTRPITPQAEGTELDDLTGDRHATGQLRVKDS
jgi:hypothetical protein